MTRRFSFIEAVLLGIAALLLLVALLNFLAPGLWLVPLACLVGIVFIVICMVRYSIDPDRLRARQSERTLKLAANTLTFMRQGLTIQSASEVCKLLLPATSAKAVAITNDKMVLGYAGAEKERHPIGTPIITEATQSVLATSRMQVVTSRQAIGFPNNETNFGAAIIVPLILHEECVGVLKFYYKSAERIDETEQAMAEGFGTLLAMQLQLAELDAQRQLAAQMELKALQAQINPHFLFNTINTIAALIRTDPAQARILLREFATFYRRTLEGSLDNISLEQEIMQTLRYLGFEIARFGSERIILESHIEKGLENIMVPAFIVQPLVENSIQHAMRDDAPLHIRIQASRVGQAVQVTVSDDGLGMSQSVLDDALAASEHLGVALRNVDDRLRGFFGSKAHLAVQSELNVGTSVTLHLGSVEGMKVE